MNSYIWRFCFQLEKYSLVLSANFALFHVRDWALWCGQCRHFSPIQTRCTVCDAALFWAPTFPDMKFSLLKERQTWKCFTKTYSKFPGAHVGTWFSSGIPLLQQEHWWLEHKLPPSPKVFLWQELCLVCFVPEIGVKK
jgi:hypothetical protein